MRTANDYRRVFDAAEGGKRTDEIAALTGYSVPGVYKVIARMVNIGMMERGRNRWWRLGQFDVDKVNRQLCLFGTEDKGEKSWKR